MTSIDWPARRLGFALGLGDLNRRPPCMGYANACVCPDCREREQIAAERSSEISITQPWMPRSKAA